MPTELAAWANQKPACFLLLNEKLKGKVVSSPQMQLTWNRRVRRSTLWEEEAFQEHGWCVVWESGWSASLKPTKRGSSHRKEVPLLELDSVDSSSIPSAPAVFSVLYPLGSQLCYLMQKLTSVGFMYAQSFGRPSKEHCTNLGNRCRVNWHYYLEHSQNRYGRSWEQSSIGKTLAVHI